MLSVRNLTKVYKTKGGEDVRALDNVSVEFPETGMVFLLGKSGSGKSTLLNLIGGLDIPTSGEVILKGRSSKDFNQSDFDSYRNTYVGFVFQEYNILNEFNVEQNIALALELQNKKVNREAIDNLLEQVDLQSFAKRKPMTLSGGQKQRIAIARALIKEPRIILADEPTGALDSKTGEQVFDTLKKLSQDKLVLVVSHDRDFAETYADRIIELKDGRIISDETKFFKEPVKISENVSIVGNNAVKIKDAKALTPVEMQAIYDGLRQVDGGVLITSGTNAEKAMKVARISQSGDSEAFKPTETIETRQYNGNETKFIRSKMPMDKSVKMGLSSLKTKPIRLIFTILLAVVSFTMFGVVSSLMLYNPAYTYSEAIQKSDYVAEKIEKYIDGTEYYSWYQNGKLSSSSTYENHKQTLFGSTELASLNANDVGLTYVGLVNLNNPSINIDFALTKDKNYYGSFSIKQFTDCGMDGINKLGYTMTPENSYPTNKYEIALPISFYNMLKANLNTINEVADAVGMTIKIGGKEFTITGFVNVDPIPSTYDQLKDGSSISELDMRELLEKFEQYLSNSFNYIGFVSPATLDEYVDTNSGNYWISEYQRRGIRLSSNVVTEDVASDTSQGIYTEEIYQKNKSLFSLYTLNGAPMTELNLGAHEILLGENAMRDNVYSRIASDFRSILEEYKMYSDYNLLPTFKAYYNANPTVIDNWLDKLSNTWNITLQDLKEVQIIIANYKDEYRIAKKLKDYIYMYTQSPAFSSLDGEMQNKIYDVNNGYATYTVAQEVYNYLNEHFDTDVPNGVVAKYFNDVHGYWDAQQTIDADSNLSAIYNITNSTTGSYPLTADEVDTIKNFVTNYFDGAYETNRTTGWTFATLDYKTNINTLMRKNYYYKNYLGDSGKLTIVGYYIAGSYSYTPLVNRAWIDGISRVAESYSENYFATDYQEPMDKRYNYVIAQTTYTQDQISLMTLEAGSFHYSMTDQIYLAASMIADMIEQMKTIFLWVGLALGAFAALMLLNFITVSISTKKKEIGVLRAIGARKGDVFKIFFSESLFIGIICFLLASIATGLVDFFLNRSFTQQLGISVLNFGLINIGLIFAIAIIITFVATIIPVWHSSRKPPVEAIRAL